MAKRKITDIPKRKITNTKKTYEDFLYQHANPWDCYIDSKVLSFAFGVSLDYARDVIAGIPTHKYVKASDRGRAVTCVTYRDLWRHLDNHPIMIRNLNAYVLVCTPDNFEELVEKGKAHKAVKIVRDYGIKKHDKKILHLYNQGLTYSEILQAMAPFLPEGTTNAVIKRIKCLVRDGHTDDVRHSSTDKLEQEIILKLYREQEKDINSIAKELGRSRTTIIRFLEKQGYTNIKTQRKYPTPEDREHFIQLHYQGLSIADISRRTEWGYSTVYRTVKN